MIDYKQPQYKKLAGETVTAEIVAVEVQENNFYDAEKVNSTKNVVEITFQTEGDDSIMYTQRYVAPLASIDCKSLFSQLMAIKGEIPNIEGGQFDEQSLLGLRVELTFGENKKGYDTIVLIKKASGKKIEKKDEDEDIPEFLK